MTEKEALKIVANPHLKWKCHEVDSALTIVRNALEKQIPKKLEVWADGTEHCPNCEHNNSCLGFKVCVSCGQRLDN